MNRYRKKPVEVEARQWDGTAKGATALLDWILACGGTAGYRELNDAPAIRINTLEGIVAASPGDWIIRGIQGEFYPCKPSVFQETYEASPDATP